MATQSQPARWMTLFLSCVVVAAAGVMVLKVAPTIRNTASYNDELKTQIPGLSNAPGAVPRRPIALAPERFPPLPADPMDAPPANSQFARYDNIVVEVKPDGTLRVLGEQMEMEAFKSLLVEQLRERLQTIVTIRPDGDCLFRHVGPVISVCEQAGVPHQTQPVPDATVLLKS